MIDDVYRPAYERGVESVHAHGAAHRACGSRSSGFLSGARLGRARSTHRRRPDPGSVVVSKTLTYLSVARVREPDWCSASQAAVVAGMALVQQQVLARTGALIRSRRSSPLCSRSRCRSRCSSAAFAVLFDTVRWLGAGSRATSSWFFLLGLILDLRRLDLNDPARSRARGATRQAAKAAGGATRGAMIAAHPRCRVAPTPRSAWAST